MGCSQKEALPLEPGFVNKTIYEDQLGSGWGVGGSAIWRLQEPEQGLFRSNASCFDLQTTNVSDSQPEIVSIAVLLCPAPPCPALPCPCPSLLGLWVGTMPVLLVHPRSTCMLLASLM